jgi:hypothetical protein
VSRYGPLEKSPNTNTFLQKTFPPIQLVCKHGLISFNGKSTEKTSENKILFEVQGKMFEKGNKMDDTRKPVP